MKKRMNATVLLILVLGLGVQVQAAVLFSDNFDAQCDAGWARYNYQGWYLDSIGWPNPGGDWTIGGWDGYQSLPDDSGVSPTLVAYNYVNTFNAGMDEPNTLQAYRPGMDPNILANGVLRITSCNSGWSDAWNTGPFLYKNVDGDFTATVEIVACDHYYNNLGGLMARVPDDPNENWVYLTYFPVWGVGNHIRNTINSASVEMGIKGYPCDPYLKLERVGSDFYLYTSPDGVTYSSLLTELSDPNDPNSATVDVAISREDMPAELQVGIFQANYAGDWMATMDFDNFVIEVPVLPEVPDANE